MRTTPEKRDFRRLRRVKMGGVGVEGMVGAACAGAGAGATGAKRIIWKIAASGVGQVSCVRRLRGCGVHCSTVETETTARRRFSGAWGIRLKPLDCAACIVDKRGDEKVKEKEVGGWKEG